MTNSLMNKLNSLFSILQRELSLLETESGNELSTCESKQDFLDLASKDIRRKYLVRLLEKYEIMEFHNNSQLPESLKKEIDRYSDYL